MLILAFDTTSPYGSAALFYGLMQLGEERSSGSAEYSVALFEMVDRLLSGARRSLAEVQIFAAATGPGSFTGIRVGLAAAQGWSKAFGRPVRGVSTLESMVQAGQPRAKIAVPIIDARRAEFYLGVFRREREDDAQEFGFSLAGETMVVNALRIGALAEELERNTGREVDFIARENDDAARQVFKQLPAWARWSTVSSYQANAIARVAWRAALDGRLQRPEQLDACYIRRSDAETNWSG
jgi:tRNA threonylcarbamoyladenosine biosynthesis protein TsaB